LGLGHFGSDGLLVFSFELLIILGFGEPERRRDPGGNGAGRLGRRQRHGRV
jgi:hypothetical protein